MHKFYQAAKALGNSDLSSLIRLKGKGLHTEMSKQERTKRKEPEEQKNKSIKPTLLVML